MILNASPMERAKLHEALRDASGWKGRNAEKTALLDQLLTTVSNDTFPGAIVPRLTGKQMVYYAVAGSHSEWRNLQPLLHAAIGRTLTDFTGIPSTLDPTDPFEALLASHGFAAVARFHPAGESNLPRATVDALLQLVRSTTQGGRARREVPRTTAQVLHEFQLALSVGNLAAADQAIDFLRTHMRLDALNLHFLEVQRDAEFQRWDALLARPFFDSVSQARRPPKVTAALVEALYRASLVKFETGDDPSGAVEYFRTELQQRYEGLFASCPPNPHPAVGKAFVVATLAQPSPDRRLVADLQAAGWPAGEARFLNSLAALLPPFQQEQTTRPIDFLRALEAEGEGAPSVDRARAALFGAAMVQTLEASRRAVDYVLRLPAADREALINERMTRGVWNEISRFAGVRGVPRSWHDWADQLPELSFAEAACAEQAVTEWPIEKHLQSPEDVKSLIVALNRAWDTAPDRLWSALPHLVAWVREDEHWPNPVYRELYETLLSLLALSSNRSSAVLAAIQTLLDGCLGLGMDQPAYITVMDDLRELVREAASLRTSDWLLDITEATVVHPCPDQAARAALWSQVTVALQQLRSRITPAQGNLAADLAMTLGMPDSFPAPQEVLSPLETARAVSRLGGGVVAIYTLTEGVGRRAQRALEALFPGIRVELMHDTVATTRLQQLTHTADVMVVCWTSAKHAATTEIQRRRPQGMPLLFASGGGSSSLLREVQAYLLSPQ